MKTTDETMKTTDETMKTTQTFNLILSIFLLSAASIHAQQTDSLRSVALNPVVITGTGTYHRADNSPLAVQVISAKQLQDLGTTNLQDALTRLTTNITTHTNGMGTFVNFNGVSDDYILILENGKRVAGDDRWQRLPMNNIKRIEVFSGAASALYGSDALAGVINIITDDGKNDVSATSSTQIMSKQRLNQEIDLDVTQGKFSSYTTYNYQQADNWQVNHYQSFDEDDTEVLKLTGRPMATGFHSHNIGERLEWKQNEQWSFFVRGNYYDNLTNRPQSATYFTQGKKINAEGTWPYTQKTAYTYDLHHTSYTYGAGARWTPNRRTHLYLDVYSDNFVSKYQYWQTAENEQYEETRKRTHYVNETLRGIFRLADWNKLSAGLELVQESLNSESDHIDFETGYTYNVFAQDEMNLLPGLDGVAGLRYTHHSGFGTAVTPTAALFYHLGPWQLRATYAGGYRTPTLSQLYATDQAKTNARYTLPNPHLDPEKNHFWNLNTSWNNSWFSFSVSGFINNIRDMINYRTLSAAEIEQSPELQGLVQEGWTTLRQRDNIDKAHITGFSTQLKVFLPYGFTVAAAYTHTDSEAKTLALDKKSGQYVTTTSPVDKSVMHVGNVNLAWDRTWGHQHLNITLNGHMQGRRYSSTYGYADPYSQFDLTVRHSFFVRQFELQPMLGIDNLFNKRDTSPWNSNFSTINPGRSLLAGIKIKL